MINSCIHHSAFSLQRAGLRGLSLNVVLNKTYRLNNHMAIQHCQQTVTDEHTMILMLQTVSVTLIEDFEASEMLFFCR